MLTANALVLAELEQEQNRKLSLFTHISLDAESQGRVGIQGNTFLNTLGYLNEYFETVDLGLSQTNSDNLGRLMRSMQQLMAHEKAIDSLRRTTPNMQPLVKQVSQQIIDTDSEQEVLFPGGWANSCDGHAMIYQFKKESDGSILFCIYNSGAGIHHHEKQSTSTSEQFFPIKRYTIPAPIDPQELEHLIERLTLAQMPVHPDRKHGLATFDADTLYQQIDKSLLFLKAKLIPVSKDQHLATLTTASQISGTCTQRSIHQMLKLNFDTLTNYQHFILGFKMYALRDFINTHPAPRSPKIAELIQLAIENNLKILQQPNVFSKELETELIQMKQKELAPDAISSSSSHLIRATTSISKSYHVDLNTQYNTVSNQSTTQQGSLPFPIHSREPMHKLSGGPNLLNQMAKLIDVCRAEENKDPLWVIDQIEQALLELPISNSTDFYDAILEANQCIPMEEHLAVLQTLYMRATEKIMPEELLPACFVTQCSFLALTDYFHTQHATKHGDPVLPLNGAIRQLLSHLHNNPYLGSHHPALDQRFIQLQKTYKNLSTEPNLLSYYSELLNKESHLKTHLMRLYNNMPQSHEVDHKALIKAGVCELYYLFEQLDANGEIITSSPLYGNVKFIPLINKLKHAILTEQLITHGFKALLGSTDRSIDDQLAIETSSGKPPALNSLCSDFVNPYSKVSFRPKVSIHANISPASRALLEADCGGEKLWARPIVKRTDNEIQLQESDAFTRQLFVLRSSPSNQINLTLDYFNQSLDKLVNFHNQQYVEANLFEPGLLIELLKKDTSFFSRFDHFIKNGLIHFQNAEGNLSQESLFFIKLQVEMNRYVAEIEPAPAETLERLIENHAFIKTQIANNRDPAILASLHHYRFMIAAAQLDNAVLADALASYFYIQLHDNPFSPPETTNRRFENTRIEKHFHDWLASHPDQLHPLIKPLVSSMIALPNVDDFELRGNYPHFTLTHPSNESSYTILLDQGKIIVDNSKTISKIPLEIRNHPVLKQLNLDNESSCFITPEGNIEFMQQGVIIQQDDLHVMKIQKEWTIHGEKAWYALKPLSTNQLKLLDKTGNRAEWDNNPNLTAQYLSEINLPTCLCDNSTQAWVKLDGTSGFITQDDQFLYEIKSDGDLEQWHEEALVAVPLLLQHESPYQERLAAFEDPQFFCVNLDATQNGTVDFVRYGLSFDLSPTEIRVPNSTLKLVSLGSFLKPEVAQLTLSDGKQLRCIVPVQRFYVDLTLENNHGEYYKVTHDLSGKIVAEEMKKKTQPWRYADSATSITYAIVDGIPKPDSAASALYLCYLYLATHEQEKAWDILDSLSQRFSLEGNIEELTYLSWIIEALPVVLEKTEDKVKKDAPLESPREIACKLKALSLYTNFLADGRKPTLVYEEPSDSSTANGVYADMSLQKVNIFHDTLSQTIYDTYTKLLNMRDHLSEHYTLSDAESKSLLNHYMHSLPPENSQVTGALGYEWRRLSLKTLLEEKNRLEAMRDSGQPMPASFDKRLTEIEKELEKQFNVMKKSTILKEIPITFYLPSYYTIKLNDLLHAPKWISDLSILDETVTEAEAIRQLSSGIGETDFIRYFPHYLQIAQTSDPITRNAIQDKLYFFCRNNIIAGRHLPYDKQESNIPYLSNILYRVMCNPSLMNSQSTPLSLSKLNDKCREAETEIEPILIHQAVDVFNEILALSQDIVAEIEQTSQHSAPIKTQPVDSNPIMQTIINEALAHLSLPKDKDSLNNGCLMHTFAETTYQNQLETLFNTTQVPGRKPTPAEDEKAAGEYQYTCTQAQRKSAEDMLSSHDIRTALITSATTSKATLEAASIALWESAITLANSTLNVNYQTQLASAKRRLLTINDLRQCYFHADKAIYIEKSGLTLSECEQLHDLIHRCVTVDVQQQHTVRLINALKDVGEPLNSMKLAQAANILMSNNLPEVKNDPTLMLFQYEENLLLRPRQADALKNLLSKPHDPHTFNESVEKIIMGGGKSKVILPLLAQQKATGLNLVIIEVPQALLATNHTDLNSTSQRLFGQKGHRFEFNRESDCSPERLEQMHQQFIDMMTHKNYLVTTGEAMQSLELKYLELLLDKPQIKDNGEAIKRWEQQVFWMSKIIEVLKQRGDVVIDELHQGLLLKKKLNYTLGAPEAISSELIQHGVNFYRFVHNSSEKGNLINDLLTDPHSPLLPWIKNLDVDELSAYLNNEQEPSFFNALPDDVKDALAFYKEELSLYPQTHARHYKEHYGPSQVRNKTALQRALAIPYSANDCPNERSRFGNPLETINYTIQSLLLDGLNHKLLTETVAAWQAQARFELQRDPDLYLSLNDTPMAKQVAEYLNGISSFVELDKLDHKSTVQMQQLLDHVRHHTPLLFHVLEHKILPQVTIEPRILHSDAYNHVDLYRSVQGVSGTPSNYRTYHHRLAFNAQTSLGTDSYIQEVLKHKTENGTPIHNVSFNLENPATKLVDFIRRIHDQCQAKDKLHAIIDISATFVGYSNLEVAKALPAICGSHNPAIQYILYFEKINDADVLHAFDIKNEKIITLGTSDPEEINQQLNCKPEERFTYYDQAHTVGVDLKQAAKGCGLCLVDETTQLQSFLQGCMRMRGLDQEQTIEIIVPHQMGEQTFEGLMEKLSQNETKQLEEDVFYAALAQMNNTVRAKALQHLASVPDADIENKRALALIMKEHLIENQGGAIYKQYGRIYKHVETKRLLDDHMNRLLDEWNTVLENIAPNASPETIDLEITTIKNTLQRIVKESIPFCKPTALSPERCNNNTEVQVQKEQEMQKEKEELKEIESHRTENRVLYEEWGLNWLHQLRQGTFRLPQRALNPDDTALFSSDLKVSNNYVYTSYSQQEQKCIQLYREYLKPVHAILFEESNGAIRAFIVTQQEAEEIKVALDNDPLTPDKRPIKLWLETTQNTLLAGDRPQNIQQSPIYNELLEQIRFFNGECAGLLNQSNPYRWLLEDTDKKIAYFKEHLLPYRETRFEDLKHLQSALSQNVGLTYIQQHATEDLTQKNWEKDYPKALPSEIAMFKALAEALYEVNTHNKKPVHVLTGKALGILNDYCISKLGKSQPTTIYEYILDNVDSADLDEILITNVRRRSADWVTICSQFSGSENVSKQACKQLLEAMFIYKDDLINKGEARLPQLPRLPQEAQKILKEYCDRLRHSITATTLKAKTSAYRAEMDSRREGTTEQAFRQTP